jgi:metal-sulfur cluster biosynthetic enzyme
VTPERLHALLTMTSPACPVTDLIVDDAAAELDRVAPAGMAVDVELAWVPRGRGSDERPGRRPFMGW